MPKPKPKPKPKPSTLRAAPAKNKLPDTGMPGSGAKTRDANQGPDAPKLTGEEAGQGR
jgi:hypothetical protein